MFGKSISTLAIATAMGLLSTLPASAQVDENAVGGPAAVRENIKDSFIVVFNSSVGRQDAPGRARAMVAAKGGAMRHIYSTAVRGFSAHMSEQAAAQLAADPSVAYVERDGLVTITKRGAKADAPPGSGGPQSTPWGITRVGGPVNGTGLVAWVIDTGIDLDHADLNVDVASSANFVARGKNSPDDGNGHGTHVAGTIAAIDNGQDVVGVAAGATVVAVRVLDNSGSGSISGVVAGVDYVAANAAPGDAANMSLGATGHFQSLHDAVANAAAGGVLFALAAGNSNEDASNHEPAHVDGANITTVSAIDINDVFASFSNWGNPPVDVAAPGVSVLSTAKGGVGSRRGRHFSFS